MSKQNNNESLKISKTENLDNYINLVVLEHKKALSEEKESRYDEIDVKLSNLEISMPKLLEVSPLNIIVYFNHNESMCLSFPRSKSIRSKLHEHILKINLDEVFAKEEMLQFLLWTGECWNDKEYSVLVEKFCDGLTLDDRSLLARLRNLLYDFVHYEKTMQVIEDACNNLKITGPYEMRIKSNYSDILDDEEFFEEEMNEI